MQQESTESGPPGPGMQLLQDLLTAGDGEGHHRAAGLEQARRGGHRGRRRGDDIGGIDQLLPLDGLQYRALAPGVLGQHRPEAGILMQHVGGDGLQRAVRQWRRVVHDDPGQQLPAYQSRSGHARPRRAPRLRGIRRVGVQLHRVQVVDRAAARVEPAAFLPGIGGPAGALGQIRPPPDRAFDTGPVGDRPPPPHRRPVDRLPGRIGDGHQGGIVAAAGAAGPGHLPVVERLASRTKHLHARSHRAAHVGAGQHQTGGDDVARAFVGRASDRDDPLELHRCPFPAKTGKGPGRRGRGQAG